MVQILAFDCGTLLTKLDLCELGLLVVGDYQVHKFSSHNKWELHAGFVAGHIDFDL